MRLALSAKLILLNALAFVILGIGVAYDLHIFVWEFDKSRLSILIAAVFLWGFALTAWEAWKVERGGEFDDFWIWHIGNDLRSLGFLGTVFGFMIGVNAFATDINKVAGGGDAAVEVLAAIVGGLGVALTTTAVGLTASLWTKLNRRILERA